MVQVTVAIPTLAGGPLLTDCLQSLGRQSLSDFQAVVVDNGGGRWQLTGVSARVTLERASRNLGYGGAVMRALDLQPAKYLVALNDDTVVEPDALRLLVSAMEEDPTLGMAAPKILLLHSGRIDSAAMGIARDGTSKQRGHGLPPDRFAESGDAFFPSGCAAIYRTSALREVGGFDESLFLYCEDTDLGLRLQRAGWRCFYQPAAVVRHAYSATAGGGSAQKVYYVERNRLAVMLKNLPWDWVLWSPLWSLARYAGHAWALRNQRGFAGQRDAAPPSFAAMIRAIGRAHRDFAVRLPALLSERRRIQRSAKVANAEFRALLARHRISLREVVDVNPETTRR